MARFSEVPNLKILKNNQFQLTEEFRYHNGLVVPKGFITDFASFPKTLKLFLSPSDYRWRRGAILHDYLYRENTINPNSGKLYTRLESDSLFYVWCILDGTPEWMALCFYIGLRIGGFNNFKK